MVMDAIYSIEISIIHMYLSIIPDFQSTYNLLLQYYSGYLALVFSFTFVVPGFTGSQLEGTVNSGPCASQNPRTLWVDTTAANCSVEIE